MNTDTASRLTFDALAYAVAGDKDGAADALVTLGSEADGNMMYGACCGLAEAGAMMLRRIYGEQAPKPGSNDMWAMEQLDPVAAADDPANTFSLRFLIAWANGDTDTCLALYEAAYQADGEQYITSISALLANVAGITRLALEQQKEEER